MVAAQEALNTLNKNNLTELRSFGTPPKAVINVCAAVLVLFSGRGKIPKDRSWRACKVCLIHIQIILQFTVCFIRLELLANDGSCG